MTLRIDSFDSYIQFLGKFSCYVRKCSTNEKTTEYCKTKGSFVRWPTYGGPQVSRQNFLSHGKTLFLTAKLSFSRQNSLSHGKTFFLTAKLSFSRQNFLSHGKTFFLTAKLSFSRQNFLFHGKTFFLKATLVYTA